MKKVNLFLLAGIFSLAILVLIPSSCKKEIYTDADALAAMKEGLKYKNDLEKEMATLQLTSQLQLEGLRSQLSLKIMLASDSLQRVGAKTTVSIQVKDVTGNTTDLSGFSVTVNQDGKATTNSTDANGLVVFPNLVTGSSSIVVAKTGFARASGIMNVSDRYNRITNQQAVLVPVFPTTSAKAKIRGTLKAQLDLTTEALEVVQDGTVSLNFNNVMDILANPNSTLDPSVGLVGVVFDGGFMQTVKTGADGKYEFTVPQTINPIDYRFAVSTIQKQQKLLFGDYPYKLDPIMLDNMLTWFGYYQGSPEPVWDNIGYYYNNGNLTSFAGLNIKIDAPAGGQTPTAAAVINWAHNDSTVVTWNFTTFAFGNGSSEFTNITQNPVFTFKPDLSRVKVITPAAGVINITNGKVISLNMTNGGVYKEYGRYFGSNGNIAPTQATGTTFRFFEQLSIDNALVNGKIKGDTTYQTALGYTRPFVKNQGKVKIPFILNAKVVSWTRKGVGYTAVPNVEYKLRIHTPGGTGTETGNGVSGDSTYTFTQNDLKVNLLAGGGLSIDTLVAGTGKLPALKAINQIYTSWAPIISTYKQDGAWGIYYASNYVSATPTNTYIVELLNGFKIADGGLGYTTAPKVRVQNYAKKQGTTGSYVIQTIAEATTTIDAQGRIISVAYPVMTDNYMIQCFYNNPGYYPSLPYSVSVPAVATGLAQAYARAIVDQYGTITSIVLYNEDNISSEWFSNNNWNTYFSGKGYLATPKVTVTPVGKTSVATPALLQAVVNNAGRVSNIIIVDGGKGYDVKNDSKAIKFPEYLKSYIFTNGSSDIVYDIDLGSGYHGKPIDIFSNGGF